LAKKSLKVSTTLQTTLQTLTEDVIAEDTGEYSTTETTFTLIKQLPIEFGALYGEPEGNILILTRVTCEIKSDGTNFGHVFAEMELYTEDGSSKYFGTNVAGSRLDIYSGAECRWNTSPIYSWSQRPPNVRIKAKADAGQTFYVRNIKVWGIKARLIRKI